MTNLGYTPEEPIAAIATALAPGAIGIVRTSGKDCIEKMTAVFSRPKALQEAEGNTLVYGWIVDKSSENHRKIDEVMLGIYRAPKSFTGEDMVEIYCHGGVSVVNAVHALLLKNGFRQAERGEYTFRAYINGKTDLTKAEAVKEIIDSKTDTSRNHAVTRLAGNLFSEISSVKTLITDSLATIEVGIEYPEDEETIADSFDETTLVQAKDILSGLVDSWKSEKLYQEGIRVVLAGKTNAGKSSLFNMLLKEDRSIVSNIEGTTRDYLESQVSFDGIPATIYDTAGLRNTLDPIEAQGVLKSRSLTEEGDLVLYMVDSTRGLEQDDMDFLSQKLPPVILVWNKCDKDGSLEPPENVVFKKQSAEVQPTPVIVKISAKQGDGIGNLVDAVKHILTIDSLKGSAGDHANKTSLGTERQKSAVCEALERVSHALDIARSGEYGLDAVVQDLEDALDNLGEVTGEVTPDDVLSSIFSHFCVGK